MLENQLEAFVTIFRNSSSILPSHNTLKEQEKKKDRTDVYLEQ